MNRSASIENWFMAVVESLHFSEDTGLSCDFLIACAEDRDEKCRPDDTEDLICMLKD